jgi:hypothetical protein
MEPEIASNSPLLRHCKRKIPGERKIHLPKQSHPLLK